MEHERRMRVHHRIMVLLFILVMPVLVLGVLALARLVYILYTQPCKELT